MAIFIHVIIALASLGFSAYTFISPSRPKLNLSYGLVVATLGSGTYLVVSTKANMLHACVMGLIYTAIVLFGVFAAQRKLAAESDMD